MRPSARPAPRYAALTEAAPATAAPAPEAGEPGWLGRRRAAMADLVRGRGAYNKPKQLTYGKPEAFTFLLGVSGDGAETRALERFAGERVGVDVDVGEEMGVRLEGAKDQVTIETNDPERQQISPRRPTQWIWQVTPKTADDIALTLRVTAYVSGPGGVNAVPIETYRDTFHVQVTGATRLKLFLAEFSPVWSVFKDVWAWLLAAIPVILGWIAWARRQRKKDDVALAAR